MKSNFYLLLFSFLCLFCFSSSSSFISKTPIPINRWSLFKKQGGVEFYIQHRSSMYDTRYNTLVRLRNTNTYEVKVSFTPSFGCEGESQMQVQGRIQTAVYPRHSVTLLAYRPCQGVIPEKIVFNSLDVRQR
ncbi:hypothetical protein Fleli_1932 [Bernardetia litoralis DSM 6794]|uniref:Uncharacterized protein n=1 Tax=Bernardetia litoralis (strain ATCC 23117 / DSM 6794 / NBRC 15988 / NCIMB 1366 / Fx l1 / Sio-4) TaxID=880071 RepID=I4AK35_BERLS|nr:hypothetical protein [Bernardetia litoralis]AFM04320.1 hypothetical protein Fleli_1932 [Bernardetia litoralis DSM 6794]